MTDIVEMLRQGSLTRDDYRWKAADEITRLTARVAELEAALRQIAGIDPWDDAEQGYVDKARAALTQPKGGE